jgi:hypothetical protein
LKAWFGRRIFSTDEDLKDSMRAGAASRAAT